TSRGDQLLLTRMASYRIGKIGAQVNGPAMRSRHNTGGTVDLREIRQRPDRVAVEVLANLWRRPTPVRVQTLVTLARAIRPRMHAKRTKIFSQHMPDCSEHTWMSDTDIKRCRFVL